MAGNQNPMYIRNQNPMYISRTQRQISRHQFLQNSEGRVMHLRTKTMVSQFLAYQLGHITATSTLSPTFCLTILTFCNGWFTTFPHQIK